MAADESDSPKQPGTETRIPLKAVLIGACAVVLLLAVRGGGDPFIGTWKLDSSDLGKMIDSQLKAQGLPPAGITPGKMPDFLTSTFGYSDSSLELRADNTYSLTFSFPLMDRTETGVWSTREDRLFLKPDDRGQPPTDGRRDGRRLLLNARGIPGTSPMEMPYRR